MNSPFQKTLRLLAALVGLVGLGSCGGGGGDGPKEQTIALFSPIADQPFSTVPVPLTALSSSGLAVEFSTSTAAVCTVSGSTARLVSTGTCTVAANQSGNDSFMPAPAVLRSFTVTLADQVITFVSPGNQVFGTAPPALLAVSTSGLPVTLVSATPAVCAVAGTTLSLLGLGDCTVAALQAGNSIYRAAPVVQQTFAVSTRGLAQTISFASPGPQVLNVPPAALVATASSGLAVSFASTTPTVCTVAGKTLSLLTSGSCTVAASQAGDQNFAAAVAVLNTFTVSGLAQTITFSSPGNQTLGVQPAALAATATSGLAVSFSSTTPAVCVVNGTVLALVNVGNCSVTASQDGNSMFAAATPVVRAFSVAPAVQTITFAGPGNQTLGTAAPPLAATSSLGLEVSFASTTPAVCTTSGTSLTLSAVGTCSITASQAGNALVAAALPVSRSFQVAAAAPTAQTITFAGPGNQTLGTAPPPLTATASSGLTVSFASTTPSTCAVNGNTLTLVAAGSCIIDASQAGNATYAAAPTVSRVVTVAAAALTAQTITFAGPGSQTLGTAPPPLTATASSGLPVSFASTTPSTCAVSGNTLTLVAAGSCIIDARQAGNATFAAAPTVSRVVTVATAAQTITFASPGNQTLGTAPPPLVFSSSSGLPVTVVSTTLPVCTVAGTTLTLVSAGTCTLSASQPGNANVAAAAVVTHTFAVGTAPLTAQSITFAGPGNQTFGVGPLALVATSSSGLTVSFATTSSGVCMVSGTTLTIQGAGTCTVTASQSGNTTTAAATPVSRDVTVARAAQVITFNPPGDQTMGTSPTLTATASSGLGVTLTSTSSACSISGNTLTLASAGPCTITATQGGNGNYNAATPVPQTFNVVRAAQFITFNAPGDQTIGTATPPLVASSSSNLSVVLTSNTPSVCTVTGTGTTLTLVSAGPCEIAANQSGNAIFAPATQVVRSFTVNPAPPSSQTITFADPGEQTVGIPSALSATASSNLTVSFASTTPSVCAVSGNALTLSNTGTCTIRASQGGDASFLAAAPVDRSFSVVRNALANLGFEEPANGDPVGEFANGWLAATVDPSTKIAARSTTEFRSGGASAFLTITDGQPGGVGLFQNSVDHGQLAVVDSRNWGTSPTLTFWLKGNVSETGNLNYALRYLSSTGAILSTNFGSIIVATGNVDRPWTLVTRTPNTVIPANTAAILIEMTLAAGPSGTFPGCGGPGSFCNWGTPALYIDDIRLKLQF